MAKNLMLRVRRRDVAVHADVDLQAAPITVLFGPSGSGKTSLLRCIAGLDRPDPGSRIVFDDQIWDDDRVHTPPQRRSIGFLFQDPALFPHLDVSRNVAYGLSAVPRRDRAARIETALEQVDAGHLRDRDPRTLSGGEAQRVALARALAPRPQLLLLDEPLSALDAPTRNRLQGQLRTWLLRAGLPAILVTHDRTEALATGDRIVVLIAGRVRQAGPPAEVFSRPIDPEVARVVDMETVAVGTCGDTSAGLLQVNVAGQLLTAVAPSPAPATGTEVLVCIRAEEVALQTPHAARFDSPRNHLTGVVRSVTADGPLVRIGLDVGFDLEAFVTRPTVEDLDLAPGAQVVAAVKAPAVHVVVRPPA